MVCEKMEQIKTQVSETICLIQVVFSLWVWHHLILLGHSSVVHANAAHIRVHPPGETGKEGLRGKLCKMHLIYCLYKVQEKNYIISLKYTAYQRKTWYQGSSRGNPCALPILFLPHWNPTLLTIELLNMDSPWSCSIPFTSALPKIHCILIPCTLVYDSEVRLGFRTKAGCIWILTSMFLIVLMIYGQSS